MERWPCPPGAQSRPSREVPPPPLARTEPTCGRVSLRPQVPGTTVLRVRERASSSRRCRGPHRCHPGVGEDAGRCPGRSSELEARPCRAPWEKGTQLPNLGPTLKLQVPWATSLQVWAQGSSGEPQPGRPLGGLSESLQSAQPCTHAVPAESMDGWVKIARKSGRGPQLKRRPPTPIQGHLSGLCWGRVSGARGSELCLAKSSELPGRSCSWSLGDGMGA